MFIGLYLQTGGQRPHRKLYVSGHKGVRVHRYVAASVREEYGVLDTALPNSWAYTLITPKSQRKYNDDSAPDSVKSCQGSNTPKTQQPAPPTKTPVTRLITKFTKVLTEEEKVALTKKIEPKTLLSACKQLSSDPSSVESGTILLIDCDTNPKPDDNNIKPKTPKSKVTPYSPSCTNTPKASEPKSASGKRRVSLVSTPRSQAGRPLTKPVGSIMTFLKKPSNAEHSSPALPNSSGSTKLKGNSKTTDNTKSKVDNPETVNTTGDSIDNCITID